jgi:hypothetical protein
MRSLCLPEVQAAAAVTPSGLRYAIPDHTAVINCLTFTEKRRPHGRLFSVPHGIRATLRQRVPRPGILDIRRIAGARRRNRMDSAACRAGVDKSGHGEGSAASLAVRGQTVSGKRPVSEFAAVSPGDKIHQFPPFGKRPRSGGVAASALCHSSHSLSLVIHIGRHTPLEGATLA